jgi:ectoine hydroxylase-related dioxygenase (phytanoyl-CoA dioxygenase family)
LIICLIVDQKNLMKLEAKSKIEKDGFIVLHDLLTAEECDFYKSELEANYNQYASMYAGAQTNTGHGLENKSQEKVVYNLHNKNLAWYKLFSHPEVLKVLDEMLMEGSYNNAEPYYMYNNSARCPLKGNPGQQLHLDSRLPGMNYCLVANVIWMLDDFTEQNGATRVYPGSHKFLNFTENGKVYDEEILITGKKGSVLIFNANLWHGGGPNFDGSSRWALALGYARWFIKPAFDYFQNVPNEIYNSLSEEQKKIIGLHLTPPKDEFTRVRRIAPSAEKPLQYKLP